MNRTKLLRVLTSTLDEAAASDLKIIPWASPIPFFGNLDMAKVATVGLNPSNREFMDADSIELDGVSRRFPTLSSLGILKWTDATNHHLKSVDQACLGYFSGNPYDAWFRVLDKLIVGLNHSYYGMFAEACHLDLCPFATSTKWGELPSTTKSTLLELSGNFMAKLIAESELRVLILNGQAVIRAFESIADITLSPTKIADWTLPRTSGRGVDGFSYCGRITSIGGAQLGREICVLGYSHNIQSSFGVTTQVRESIGAWISDMAKADISLHIDVN